MLAQSASSEVRLVSFAHSKPPVVKCHFLIRTIKRVHKIVMYMCDETRETTKSDSLPRVNKVCTYCRPPDTKLNKFAHRHLSLIVTSCQLTRNSTEPIAEPVSEVTTAER